MTEPESPTHTSENFKTPTEPEFTSEEIIEALIEIEDNVSMPTANMLTEKGVELRELGFRDISEAAIDEAAIMNELMKSVQVQRTLDDFSRQSRDKRSTIDYLEQHVDFLIRISPGKTKKEIIRNMTLEHAEAIMKVAAKADVPEKLLKKHLSTLKHKYV
jgi:hypothetical protein